MVRAVFAAGPELVSDPLVADGDRTCAVRLYVGSYLSDESVKRICARRAPLLCGLCGIRVVRSLVEYVIRSVDGDPCQLSRKSAKRRGLGFGLRDLEANHVLAAHLVDPHAVVRQVVASEDHAPVGFGFRDETIVHDDDVITSSASLQFESHQGSGIGAPAEGPQARHNLRPGALGECTGNHGRVRFRVDQRVDLGAVVPVMHEFEAVATMDESAELHLQIGVTHGLLP